MVDLEDIALIIHFRRDVDDRFRNLKTVVEFYQQHSKNLEIILINDDKVVDNEFKELCKEYKCKGFFLENDEIYWRTKAFNHGVNNSKSKYIIAGDTDVIIDPKYLLKAKNILRKNPKIGILYPYNGMFVHVRGDLANNFFKTKSLDKIELIIPELKPIPYHQSEDFLVAHPQSKGGMVMFSKDNYYKCGGYNTNFRGWGYEDDEILARFTLFGYSVERVTDERSIAWHLPHDNTVREQHPYYENNRKHSDFVCNCKSIKQLQEYVSTWEI